MNIEEARERFINTLLEIEGIIKKNSKIINLESIIKIIDIIYKIYAKNKMVFVYGAGRSGFIGRCFAQRLMHLGIKSCYISDAITQRYTKDDLLVIISGSGETPSPKAIAQQAKEIGGKVILITGNPYSTIAKLSDMLIEIEGKSKDVAISKSTFAPYTSLFDISVLAVLDSITGTLMKIIGVKEEDIDKRHASLE